MVVSEQNRKIVFTVKEVTEKGIKKNDTKLEN